MTHPKDADSKLHRWRILRICGTPVEHIGYVEAPDAKAAIKKAISAFSITSSEKQKWLVAERVD